MLRHTQRRSWRIILCIRNHATFEDLITFSRESIVGGGNTYKGTVTTCHASHKLPDFKVPHFNDETIEGQDLVKSVERTFKSHVLLRYLSYSAVCEANLEWSSALASRIWESLSKISILNFIAAEQESENNCHRLFLALNNHLSTVDADDQYVR